MIIFVFICGLLSFEKAAIFCDGFLKVLFLGVMVVKHCCYGLCTSDNRYPERMPEGTNFLPFAKPGIIKEGMTPLEKERESAKTQRAKRWMHACGRKNFCSLSQITKHTYICSLHFDQPIGENSDPRLSTVNADSRRKRRKLTRISLSPESPAPSIPEYEETTLAVENSGSPIPLENMRSQSTQTEDLSNSILVSQVETKILKEKLFTAQCSNERNPMNLNQIMKDTKVAKYFTGLFPEEFDALFNFLGDVKHHLVYWGTKSSGEAHNRVGIQNNIDASSPLVQSCNFDTFLQCH